MRYAYVRVSSAEQNLSRQYDAVRTYAPDLKSENVFADKQSGKNFNRPEYQKLKSVLVAGDEVVIKELDRLGRNKDGIKSELQWFNEHGIIVRVLDVPTTLIDFQGQAWIADMVNNILIEVMGAIAEQERVKIQKRQREGIDAMPVINGKKASSVTGKYTGRPNKTVAAFDEYFRSVQDGTLSATAAAKKLGISRAQWYRLIKEVA